RRERLPRRRCRRGTSVRRGAGHTGDGTAPRVVISRGVLPAAVVAVLALSAPAVAVAQPGSTSPLSPFTPSLPPSPSTTQTTTTAVPTTTTGGGSLSGGSVIAIAIGALVVLGGISLFIW